MTGLYIHIPFCQSICPYCDFSTWKASSKQHVRWLNIITQELHLRIPKGIPIKTLFLGGGTPSLLEPDTFNTLMDRLNNHLNLSNLIEFTLEANPISLDKQKLLTYSKQGVTKISLGVQSFSDKHLKTLGRLHSPLQAKQSIQSVQDAGFLTNVDLMFGIPNQLLSHWKQDLSFISKLKVHHASLYGLTFEKNTLFHQHLAKKILKQIPEKRYAKMYLEATTILSEAGLNRYEVSNFAKPNCESIHNKNYWNHTPYYGLGPGAHSFDGTNRFFNSKKFADYERFVTNKCVLNSSNHETLNQETLYQESLWLGLRTSKGINLSWLANQYSKRPTNQCIQDWVMRNMLEKDQHENLFLINEGWLFLDTIVVDCLARSSYI